MNSSAAIAHVDRLIETLKERHRLELADVFAMREELVAERVGEWLGYAERAGIWGVTKEAAKKQIKRLGVPRKIIRGRAHVSRAALDAAVTTARRTGKHSSSKRSESAMSTADYERGQTEERHRIGTILSSEVARKQPQLAAQLTFKQATPAEQALGILRSF